MCMCYCIGVGIGMAYLPAMIAVCFYFEKRRTLATGIALCGSGIGNFLFAPLTTALLSKYSWKGTLLIEAGILLNCSVFAMLFRPLNVAKKPDLAKDEASEEKTPIKAERRRHSVTSCTSSTELIGSMPRKDSVYYYKSLDNIPQFRADLDADRSITAGGEPQDKSWLAKIGITKEMRQAFTEIMDFRLLLDAIFILFVVSNFLTSIGFVVPYVFLPSRGLRLRFDVYEATLLISMVGISNTVGRVFFGYVGDLKCMNRLMLANTVRVICGICSVVSVFLRTFPLQMCYAISFGFTIGTYIAF